MLIKSEKSFAETKTAFAEKLVKEEEEEKLCVVMKVLELVKKLVLKLYKVEWLLLNVKKLEGKRSRSSFATN